MIKQQNFSNKSYAAIFQDIAAYAEDRKNREAMKRLIARYEFLDTILGIAIKKVESEPGVVFTTMLNK